MSFFNPFKKTRFEQEGTHLYYLPQVLKDKLEESKSLYLIGTRGTGKTTLLKSLDWDERLNNKSLFKSLDHKPFHKNYIGLYFKLYKMIPLHFQDWLNGDHREKDIFGLFIDLLWLEELAKAISTLCVKKGCLSKPLFKASPKYEYDTVKQILDLYPELMKTEPYPIEYTFGFLGRQFNILRNNLQKASMGNKDISDTMVKYPAEPIGVFGHNISKYLAEFCNNHSIGDIKWYFNICIDEAEWFTSTQDIVINTMVRLSEWPTFFKISYVRGLANLGDIYSTVRDNVSLSDPDRSIIDLDKITEVDTNIFEGVANIRIQQELNKPNIKLDLNSLLGGLDINYLLQIILRRSKSPKATLWRDLAIEFGHSSFAKSTSWELPYDDVLLEDKTLPLYQAYIVHKLILHDWLNYPLEDTVSADRLQKMEQLRKSMVAAYLCMCNELKRRDVLYASAIMVKQMSDNCVRDFLNFISEIFIECNCSLEDFLNMQVPINIQSEAIERASMNKRANIPRSRASFPEELGKIVDGLAILTHSLQSEYLNPTALKSNERGRYLLELDMNRKTDVDLKKYINDGIENGYFYVISCEKNSYVFRLHTSLAAAYKFSYRGAYATTRIEPSDIISLLDANDDKSVEKASNNIFARLSKIYDPYQSILFDPNEEVNGI